MVNQEMIEITIHDVPKGLSQKIEAYARVHNMSADDAVSYMIKQYLLDMNGACE